MAHWAKVVDGIVTKVIVADADFFDTFIDNSPGKWVQTSYNTDRGVHLKGGTPLRKNFAGVGFSYDEDRDAFIPPKPYDSWVLDEETCIYNAPIDPPADEGYEWNEETQSWDAIE